MHRQPFATTEVTHDAVARNRAAAQSVFHRSVFAAIERERTHAVRVVGSKTLAREQQGIGLVPSVCQQIHHALGHYIGDALTQANISEQLFAVFAASKAHDFVP
jgi:hypothetical protein